MRSETTRPTRPRCDTRLWRTVRCLALWLVAAGACSALYSCSDSGIDPDTAEIIKGDVKDTITGPDLTKAVVRVGIVGDASNLVVQDFIGFEHATRYMVDTLSDGSVEAVSGLTMIAELADHSTSGEKNPLEPIRSFRVRIPHIATSVGLAPEVELDGDPHDATASSGGISATLSSGEEYSASGRDDDRFGRAHIESVNRSDRTISIAVSARLRGNRNSESLQYIALDMLIELPY